MARRLLGRRHLRLLAAWSIVVCAAHPRSHIYRIYDGRLRGDFLRIRGGERFEGTVLDPDDGLLGYEETNGELYAIDRFGQRHPWFNNKTCVHYEVMKRHDSDDYERGSASRSRPSLTRERGINRGKG